MKGFPNDLSKVPFGEYTSQMFFISIILAALIIGVGIFLLKKQSSKGKETIGWICIGMGCISILNAAVQFFT